MHTDFRTYVIVKLFTASSSIINGVVKFCCFIQKAFTRKPKLGTRICACVYVNAA